MNKNRVKQLIGFINERDMVRVRKENGSARPWTKDPVLDKFHFCNIRREDDRGTKELREVQKTLQIATRELPLFYTAARLFNRATSVRVWWLMGVNGLKRRREAGEKIFNNAYTVATGGVVMDKIDYVDHIAHEVDKLNIHLMNDPTCRHVFNELMTVRGLGSFLCGQIVADLKYTKILEYADDWYKFAVMGPGSQKGLNFIFGDGTTERNFTERLTELGAEIGPHIPQLHNQDLQNCMCEFSKYIRYTDNLPGRRRNYHANTED